MRFILAFCTIFFGAMILKMTLTDDANYKKHIENKKQQMHDLGCVEGEIIVHDFFGEVLVIGVASSYCRVNNREGNTFDINKSEL